MYIPFLDVGMLTWVTVKSNPTIDTSVIKLSNKLPDLRSGIQKRKTNILFPGTSLDFTVDKVIFKIDYIEERFLSSSFIPLIGKVAFLALSYASLLLVI